MAKHPGLQLPAPSETVRYQVCLRLAGSEQWEWLTPSTDLSWVRDRREACLKRWPDADTHIIRLTETSTREFVEDTPS